jgi:CRP-like cAMP-binding protein
MAKSKSTRPQNTLLAHLPANEYQRLSPHLEAVALSLRQTIYAVRSPIDYVYFPLAGVISAMTVMLDGSAIEVATIGNEGMTGLLAFVGGKNSPYEVMVQVPGDALRMRADILESESKFDGPLRRLLVTYHEAFSMQVSYAVACNGLHLVQKRCCRWLLMTHDRVGSDELPLTHEFLAIMLGVRRASVTEVLKPLQDRGLIENSRGKITLLDRAGLETESCECYGIVRDEFARLFG